MKIEYRSANEIKISGYVNAVERDSRILPQSMCKEAPGPFVERIKAKTFEKYLSKNKPVGLKFNHEKMIGSTADGNLVLREDNIGLYAESVITDPEVIAESKNFKGWSFAFSGATSTWTGPEDGIYRRSIEDFEDFSEVSILTLTPAYIGTSVEMRADTISETEKRGFADDIEVEEVPEPYDFSNLKREVEILKIKGEIYHA